MPNYFAMFPSPKGGGSIEGRTGSSTWSLPRGFHRRRAVAPLKAPPSSSPSHSPRSFHRRRAVAPLKGRRMGRHNATVCWFPSPKGGGSIEGPPIWNTRTVAHKGFHRRRAVAPLKGGGSGRAVLHRLPSFHRRRAVAPLKGVRQFEPSQTGELVSIAEGRWLH